MHVVHVGFHRDVHGRAPTELLAAWPTLSAVAEAVREAGVAVTVVQTADDDDVIERAGVQYHFVRERSWLARRGPGRVTPPPRRLVRRVTRMEPDVVHVHGFSFPWATIALRRAIPTVPVVVQDHADRPPPAWARWWYRRAFRGVAGALFTGAGQAAPFRATGLLSEAVPVFEVLEASSRFTPGDREAARRITGIDGDPALLWIGRLDENKDPLTVIDAMPRVALELPGAKLWCYYTDAPLLAQVRHRLAAVPGLANRITLGGAVSHDRVEWLCRAADCLVSVSHTEGSGYAVIEALACGTPVVLSDIPSYRAITGGRVGTLVPVGDAGALADGILRSVRQGGAATRQTVRDHFDQQLSYAVLGRRLAAVYRQVAVVR